MEEYSHIEDKIVLMVFSGLLTTIYIIILYAQKVKGLLRDNQKLIEEREREREARAQRQKLEALGLVAAGISHEINSSLQAILGNCEMARNRMENTAPAFEFIKKAIDNSLHARRVISNVLTFSNSPASTASFELHQVPINSMVEEAVEYSLAYLPPTIQIDVKQTTASPLINADRISFIQIISNLINNAAQAMEYHGTVNVTTGIQELNDQDSRLTGNRPGPYASVSLVDTGRGVATENLAKVFDPFFTTKQVGEGTGLGLSIVHGLIKNMGGHVTIQSKVDVGTEITIFLPVIKDDTHAR